MKISKNLYDDIIITEIIQVITRNRPVPFYWCKNRADISLQYEIRGCFTYRSRQIVNYKNRMI
ncbi:hypothetical protein DDZ16_14345 [Marinilabilia rubra]|uniref:Uncharacterized protein n=1 Tax=Marinilabilia rubra TaxID=2162893 RepID=A0A2U2B6D6_9BACT|nr:hypothetical protein DDZ16_14345 [Marinilabilia rubra]